MAAPTRFLRGARLILLSTGLGGAALAWPALAGAAPDDDPGPLPWRVGGRVGFTVDAAAFPDSLGQVLEVYVRVPPVTIAALSRDSTGKSKLRLVARVRGAFGATQQAATQEFETDPSDSAAGFGKVLLL